MIIESMQTNTMISANTFEKVPDVSVVMSVYNGATYLRETIDSILNQEGVLLEFIIVDDGSTDDTPRILSQYASNDSRVKIIYQKNQGLTRALIRGCAAAKGKYIARQDAGDVSLPGRLIKQLNCIAVSQNAAFVSCGTRFVGPAGELLYEVNQDISSATNHLLTLDTAKLKGPSSHPSTLFLRSLYESVGGYREAFYFAQDIDLWVRLVERGRHIVIPETLYQASVTVGALSGLYRKEQIKLTKLIVESAKLRRNGCFDQDILSQAASIRPVNRRNKSWVTRAKALYFIGSCLQRRNDHQSSYYFRQALKSYPFHLKSAIRLLAMWIRGAN